MKDCSNTISAKLFFVIKYKQISGRLDINSYQLTRNDISLNATVLQQINRIHTNIKRLTSDWKYFLHKSVSN